MVKYFVLLFNLIGLLIFNFFTNDVSVTINAPKEVQAGTEFQVELVIAKGKITGLGRFEQTLPEGLTAVTDNNSQLSNADFQYKYQKVRLMWLLLPADESLTIKYTIQVAPNFQGKIKLGGSFVYLVDNARMNANVPEQIVEVTPGTGVVASNLTKTDSTKSQQNTVSILPPDRNVTCTRTKPTATSAGDGLMVTLTVTKDMANNYAKIQEEIPAGFKAEAVETKGAVFTFKDKMAKFLWMNLPVDGNFTISYKLVPEDKYVSKDAVQLKGSFSFMENEKTYNVDIKQTGEQLADNKQVKTDTVKTNKNVAQNTDLKKQTEANKKKEAELKKEQQKKDDQLKKDEAKKEKQRQKDEAKAKDDQRKKELAEQKKNKQNKTNTNNSVTDPQKGVVYKVQLAAGHSPINVTNYFRNLKVNNRVATELHDGWRKYTIGAYPKYQAARDQRVFIWGNTPINDAFVSAYNNGNRITVQEALMIVSQKWIQ